MKGELSPTENFDFKESVRQTIAQMFCTAISSRKSLNRKFLELTDNIKTGRRLGVSRREIFLILENVVEQHENGIKVQAGSTLQNNSCGEKPGNCGSNRRLCEAVMKSLVPSYHRPGQKSPPAIQLTSDFRNRLTSLIYKSACLWCQTIVLAVLVFSLTIFPILSMAFAGWSESVSVGIIFGTVVVMSLLVGFYYELYFKPRSEKLRRWRISLAASSSRENILACLYVRQRTKFVWRRISLLILFSYFLLVLAAMVTESPSLGVIFTVTIIPAFAFYCYCVGLWLDTFPGKILAIPAIVIALPVVMVIFFMYFVFTFFISVLSQLFEHCRR